MRLPGALNKVRSNMSWVGRELRLFRRWALAALRAPFRRSMFRGVETYLMFLGHPRTGHSLIGQLLNAHPRMLVSHELDALKYIKRGLDDEATLFSLIYDRELWFRSRDREWTGYSYQVPGGRQDDTSDLVAIGDKKGAGSAVRLRADPELLDRLRGMLSVELRVLHVVRHPLDSIATEVRKGPGSTTLLEVVAGFFDRCEVTRRTQDTLSDGEMLTLHFEDFVGNPPRALERLCGFIGLPAEAAWIEACDRFVYDSPRRSRDAIDWPPGVLDAVASLSRRYEFLHRYEF